VGYTKLIEISTFQLQPQKWIETKILRPARRFGVSRRWYWVSFCFFCQCLY